MYIKIADQKDKSGRSALREAFHVNYAFIDKHKSLWPVSVLCEQLEISASEYYQHRQRQTVSQGKPSGRISNDMLLARIKTIHVQFKTEYGWLRMWKELLANGVRVGRERVDS